MQPPPALDEEKIGGGAEREGQDGKPAAQTHEREKAGTAVGSRSEAPASPGNTAPARKSIPATKVFYHGASGSVHAPSVDVHASSVDVHASSVDVHV